MIRLVESQVVGPDGDAVLSLAPSSSPDRTRRVWTLSRNCALTPRQVGWFYLSLVAASLVIALGFLVRGAWMVLPFSVVEMAALGLALLVYARHAVDCERVSLDAGDLVIEAIDGSRRSVTRVDARAARVELASPRAHRASVEVVARGTRIAVGRFVCDRERRQFARQLSHALRVH